MKLGSYPSHRYSRAWLTQRLLNRAPEWTAIRKFPVSVGHQILNPIVEELQETLQQLNRERYNSFLSTADLNLLDVLYEAKLGTGMDFSYVENVSGQRTYSPPAVYATIDSVEYEITQAEKNDIETLSFDSLPSRIETPGISYEYQEIIPETLVQNLSTIVPNAIVIPSHLYITLKENSNWSIKAFNKIFYSKILITGTTRKGTEVAETVPLSYNGTFKTINEWSEISSVFVAYLSSSATVTIETFPFGRESLLDTFNVSTSSIQSERLQFTRLESKSWGSCFVAESFTLDNINLVRDSNLQNKEANYEIELLSEGEGNVSLYDYVQLPYSRFIYTIDNQYLYVYDVNLPYANGETLKGSSSEYKIELFSDKWIVPRGDFAQIRTRNLGEFNVPTKVRWSVLDPDGIECYMGLDGSLWPTTTSSWIDNNSWSNDLWHEQVIDFEITKTGEWTVSLEAEYYDEQTSTVTILTSKYLFFTPSIVPEIQLELPLELQNSTNIFLDSDKNVWLLRYDGIHKLNIFHDYFIVDYEEQKIFLKENYSSIRIVTNG